MQQASFLTNKNGQRLAYVATEGSKPGIIFLTGFKSDMNGAKALALEAHCRETGQAYVRFDYSGHGASEGAFEDGTIGQWLDDALLAFDHLTHGPQIVVGSSMGGWIACLLALRRPERVAALVGLAAAPDFTEALIWEKMGKPERALMRTQGYIEVPNCYGAEPYRITRQLIEEGRNHLLLTSPARGEVGERSEAGGGNGVAGAPSLTLSPSGGGNIAITCPVRLLHGMRDEDVSYQVSQALLEQLASEDVELTLIKNGGHRLSEPDQLGLLTRVVGELSSPRRRGSMPAAE